MEVKLEQAIQCMLNKINRVTCPHRHGNKVSKESLDNLSNAQLDFEKFLETYNKENAND